MTHVFTLNAEGGPLLLCDVSAVKSWNGAEKGTTDYEQLCSAFDSNPGVQGMNFPVGASLGLAWEMSGAGVADVFLDEGGKIVIVRVWVNDDNPSVIKSLAELPAMNFVPIGRLSVTSRKIAILWAAESGKELSLESSQQVERAQSGTAIEASVYTLRTEANTFDCFHDEVAKNGARARRLTLIPRHEPMLEKAKV